MPKNPLNFQKTLNFSLKIPKKTQKFDEEGGLTDPPLAMPECKHHCRYYVIDHVLHNRQFVKVLERRKPDLILIVAHEIDAPRKWWKSTKEVSISMVSKAGFWIRRLFGWPFVREISRGF